VVVILVLRALSLLVIVLGIVIRRRGDPARS